MSRPLSNNSRVQPPIKQLSCQTPYQTTLVSRPLSNNSRVLPPIKQLSCHAPIKQLSCHAPYQTTLVSGTHQTTLKSHPLSYKSRVTLPEAIFCFLMHSPNISNESEYKKYEKLESIWAFREKTCLRCFQQSEIQTSLLSYRD